VTGDKSDFYPEAEPYARAGWSRAGDPGAARPGVRRTGGASTEVREELVDTDA